MSGGEPMAQPIEFIEALCRRLSRRGYRVDIDTCGYAPYERFERILPFTDTFLFDIKHMDPEKHKQLTGVSNELILENIRKLSADGARISLRLPLIRGLNDDEQEITAVIDLAREISPVSVHLLPYHTAGSDKYERLGTQAAPGMQVPEPERLSRIEQRFRTAGFASVKIGG